MGDFSARRLYWGARILCDELGSAQMNRQVHEHYRRLHSLSILYHDNNDSAGILSWPSCKGEVEA
jgi:hypothetical protein